MPKKNVLLDTNSLIYSIKNRIDLRKQIAEIPEIGLAVIPQCVIDELRGLSHDVPEAKGALEVAGRFGIIESTGKGDECIISVALSSSSCILTNDRALILRAKELGVRTLSIRNEKRIQFNP